MSLVTAAITNLGELTLLVQDEGADYQHGDGPHGCEVHPKHALGNTSARAPWETPVFSLCARLCLSIRLNLLNIWASFKNKP